MAATYRFDEKTDSKIEQIRLNRDVSSKTEVIRRAIALLSVIDRLADAENSSITLLGRDGKEREIIVW